MAPEQGAEELAPMAAMEALAVEAEAEAEVLPMEVSTAAQGVMAPMALLRSSRIFKEALMAKTKEKKEEKKEEKKATRHELLSQLRAATMGRLKKKIRPLDSDDMDALEALLGALLAGRKDGYSDEEIEALEALWADFREARSNTK